MAVRRVVVAVHRQHALDPHAGRVHRHQHHAVPRMRLAVGIRQAHEHRDLAARMADAGGPPLAAVQDQFVAVLADRRAHVGGIRRRHFGLGHAEHRADLTGQQWRQPTRLLRRAAEVVQHFHVAGVRRAAVEDLGEIFIAAHQLGQRRVFQRGQARAEFGIRQEQVPQAGGARLRLPFLHQLRHLPVRPVRAGHDGDFAAVVRLARGDVFGDERAQALQVVLRLRARREVHQPIFSSSLPVFSPRNSLSSASGKVSKPSTMSSRDCSRPSASQPPISRAASP